ncbi:unnamed protein product [Trypanosoma congolense IL3000]|uniref:WGS project CAEQ00000000 data, annotated contig 2268 n=1 Tax=Trypanosoma congolense (strain IL3000) TaxID=1068625 RepID=F9WCU0_TRYCI|nr:unnamed protein product [Trypanosoma congolense IL3000]
MYAQVVVSKELLSKCLEETLRTQPIIVALTANGVAFSLLVDDVLVSDSILDRQVIFITVRGVFMGGCFDVTVPAVQPDNTVDEAKRICEMLVPRIIEQSDTQLWTLHHMFVGSVDSSSPASPIRGDAGVKSEGSVQKTPSVEICAPLLPKETISSGCEGGFQESWADREKIMLDGNFWV